MNIQRLTSTFAIAFCIICCGCIHEPFTNQDFSEVLIKSFLKAARAQSGDTTKFDVLINRVSFKNISKLNIDELDQVLILDLISDPRDEKAKIIFLTQENIILSSFVISLSNLDRVNNVDQLIVDEILKRQIEVDYTGKISIFNLDLNLISFNRYADGKLRGTGVAIKEFSKTESGRLKTCIEWYLVTTNYYSDGSSETTVSYLYTSCSEPCSFAGRVDCGGGGGNGSPNSIVEGNNNRLCGLYDFAKVGDGYTAEIMGLGAKAKHSTTNRVVFVSWSAMCITFGSSIKSSRIASEKMTEAWNSATNDLLFWLDSSTNSPTDLQVSRFLLNRFKFYLGLYSGGYTAVSVSSCIGQIPRTQAAFC